MATPYVGEIRMVGFNFAPVGWFLCNGQLLDISQYSVLFNLIGTTYGGNGTTTFALPNLQSRIPIHPDNSTIIQGQISGTESVTLTTNQIPMHTHTLQAAPSGPETANPAGALPVQGAALFMSGVPSAQLAPQAVRMVGGSQPHENRPPFLALNFIIAWAGIFPSHS